MKWGSAIRCLGHFRLTLVFFLDLIVRCIAVRSNSTALGSGANARGDVIPLNQLIEFGIPCTQSEAALGVMGGDATYSQQNEL
jgi:hypothetical protein